MELDCLIRDLQALQGFLTCACCRCNHIKGTTDRSPLDAAEHRPEGSGIRVMSLDPVRNRIVRTYTPLAVGGASHWEDNLLSGNPIPGLDHIPCTFRNTNLWLAPASPDSPKGFSEDKKICTCCIDVGIRGPHVLINLDATPCSDSAEVARTCTQSAARTQHADMGMKMPPQGYMLPNRLDVWRLLNASGLGQLQAWPYTQAENDNVPKVPVACARLDLEPAVFGEESLHHLIERKLHTSLFAGLLHWLHHVCIQRRENLAGQRKFSELAEAQPQKMKDVSAV